MDDENNLRFKELISDGQKFKEEVHELLTEIIKERKLYDDEIKDFILITKKIIINLLIIFVSFRVFKDLTTIWTFFFPLLYFFIPEFLCFINHTPATHRELNINLVKKIEKTIKKYELCYQISEKNINRQM